MKAKLYRAFGVECTIQEIANGLGVTDQSVRNQINKGTLEEWLASKGVYSGIELMDITGKRDQHTDFEREYEARTASEIEALGYTPFGSKKAKPEEVKAIMDAISPKSEPEPEAPRINPFQEAEDHTTDNDQASVQHADPDRDVSGHALADKLERYNAAIDALQALMCIIDHADDPELLNKVTILAFELKDRRAYDYSYMVNWDDILRRLKA